MTIKHTRARVVVINGANGIVTKAEAYLSTGDHRPTACLDVNGLTIKSKSFRHSRFTSMTRAEAERMAVTEILFITDKEIEALYREKLELSIESLEERVPELEETVRDAKKRLTELRELQFRTLGMTTLGAR